MKIEIHTKISTTLFSEKLAIFFFKKWKNIYSLLLPGCENSPQEKTIIAKVHSSQ